MKKTILFALAMLALIASPVRGAGETLVLSYIPYIEPNTATTLFGAYLDVNGTMLPNATVNFEFGGSNYTMPYNGTSNAYESTVVFSPLDIGNWTFKVYANQTGHDTVVTSGAYKVRNPIFLNVRLFSDNNNTAYKDEQAQVIVKGNYSCYPIVTRTTTDILSGTTTYYTDCYFHANYTGGVATLRVYELGPYVTDFISATNFIYDNQFAYPTIERQNYGFTLGSFTVDTNPRNIDVVMNSCELNPQQCQNFYFSMFLWILFLAIAGAIGIIAGKWTGSGGVAFGTAVIVLIGLIILRFALLGF